MSGQFLLAGITATGTATLIQLQAPANLSNLTSDPPEDLTILRVRGHFSLTMDSAAATTGEWVLALVVQDTTWTPSAAFTTDADKRILWSRNFHYQVSAAGNVVAFHPPGLFQDGVAGNVFPTHPSVTEVDIAPKVKIEPGKALFLVAYEVVDGTTLDVVSTNMRVLFQRTKRQR